MGRAAKSLNNLKGMKAIFPILQLKKGLVIACELPYHICRKKKRGKFSKKGKTVKGIENSTELEKDVLIERWSKDSDLQKWNRIILSHTEEKNG